MINAARAEVDVEEMRLWANGYRDATDPPMPWSSFGNECGIPAGTLQPWATGKYQGDNQKHAKLMLQFKQQIEAGAKRREALPTDPGYFETETSSRIEELLAIAHTGRITVGGSGPGTGKTITIKEYGEKAQPVWVATMKPSTKRVMQMIMEVHKALGMEPRHMMAAQASREVTRRIEKRKGLLVIDEANHLTIDAIEEIRSWHDETDVGICFLGNQELVRRFNSGKHKEQFARLNSRVTHQFEQDVPTPGDLRAFCSAWRIDDPAMQSFLHTIGTSPDAGGLRECRQLVEMGSVYAENDSRGLSLEDLRDVQAGRATRWIKT